MTPFISGINILFVAGFGPITHDNAQSQLFYKDALNLPLNPMEGNSDYLSTSEGELKGVKHFALWPLEQAAMSCFGDNNWVDSLPVPQYWVEFEVEDIDSATEALKQKGYQLLVDNRIEPWGQTVTRLLSPEGALVGLTITPWLRDN
ncbi:glyoxalase [Proteus cibarius]|uniref:glyoxalase n=1 Tax=Proteus terrae TaxID=1574161 RepID=UPI0018C7A842|nr:glyoxalase [Proteus terrae]MBG6039726.1 glyoxalase [Proteus terrae subsp. cibarius]